MEIDKPLKYFLISSAIFISFIAVFVVASLKKTPIETSELPVLNPNDPLLIIAKSKAKASMDTLFKCYSDYPDNSFARFAFELEKGTVKHIWAKVSAINDSMIIVKAEEEHEQFTGELELNKGEVEDWLIEIKDNQVLGGFTTQVLLIREKEAIPEDSLRIDSLLRLFVYPVN